MSGARLVVPSKEPLAPDGRCSCPAVASWPRPEDWSARPGRGLGSEHAHGCPSSSGIGTHTVHTPGTHRAVMGTSRSLA